MTDSSRRERLVRVAVGSSALVVGLNLNTVSIAFADMREHAFKGESLAALGWVLSVYTIFFGALLVPAGRLADRLGRRSVFLWAWSCSRSARSSPVSAHCSGWSSGGA